ncbi:nucleotidyltransferase domain-containing protein [Neomoorella humiferrea]|uniref:nucleotidyltransferase domain-containing protein n=1 Tax=Neomoorella humiferrea TaxID=676965 RepID=UPI003BAE56E5
MLPRSVEKEKVIPIQKVYLFGSQAKGIARIDSDIDLIIVSPAFSGMPLWER